MGYCVQQQDKLEKFKNILKTLRKQNNLLFRPHQPKNPRDHQSEFGQITPLQRKNQRHRAPLLPFDRG